MPTRIKVCCLASAEEVRAAVEAGADAVGFVGVRPASPRTLPDEAIAALMALVPASVDRVLLTAEPSAEAISAQVRRTGPTSVQIAARLSPDELARLAALEPQLRRVLVVYVNGPEALDLIEAYAAHVHAFLLDSGRPDAQTPVYGGTGLTHDWAVSAAFVQSCPLPVFLAGGLDPANVGEAIARVRPFGVDLCSGLRTDRRLDPGKLAAFFEAVRRADAELAGA